MYDYIRKLIANDKIRYLIAGGATTAVNLVAFYVLRVFLGIERNLANLLAIITAIIFAYFANKFFVFRSNVKGFFNIAEEALSFFFARLLSMAVEILGVALLCDSFRMNEFIAKLFIQFVVVILNYVFSKLFVFTEKKRSIKERFYEDFVIYMPFVIVFIVMAGVFVVEKIAPLGRNSLTLVDSIHQYVPFFSEYRDKLLNEGSMFYSRNIALGSNFVSLSAYYLASPLNFIVLLFSKENIIACMCILMAFKVCLSASTMAYYLSHASFDGKEKGKSSRFCIIGISVAYALNNYVVGYYWNIMWLDCLFILPLIILGFQRMMEGKGPKLYALTLFYALYCNYYIGYMICLFLILWFFMYRHKTIKKFFMDGIRFAVASILSAGMAAFSLVPAYYGIKSTASGTFKLPKLSWYGDIFLQLKQQIVLSEPINNQVFDGGLNLYCGTFAIFTAFLFVFCTKAGVLEKIRYYIVIAFLFAGFNCTMLNYIWHGMHDQYGIPNRFSFVLIFILLVMAYRVFTDMKNIWLGWVVLSCILSSCYVGLCYYKTGQVSKRAVIITAVLLFVYGTLCMLRSHGNLKKKAFDICICVVCSAELIVSGVNGLIGNGSVDIDRYYESSPAVTKAYSKVKAMAKEESAEGYRAELMDSTVLDEATWHNMPSVGIFCSTVLGEVVTTMSRLGFYTGANEFLYMGSSPFTNSILNVDYLLYREGDLNNFDFDYVKDVEGVGIYTNPYPLSIAFGVDKQTKDWNRDAGNQYLNNNNLAMYMTGEPGMFRELLPELSVSSTDCEVKAGGKTITFTPYESGKNTFQVSFEAPEDGDYYLNCRGNEITKIRFYVNGAEYAYDRYQIQLFHIGNLKTGDYVSVEYEYRNITVKERTASIGVAMFNHEHYEKIYDKLDDYLLNVTTASDGYYKGTINIPEDKIVFTSIPYDEGWTLKVDGKAAPYFAIGEAFIGFELLPGEHEIELSYMPRGLKTGILISIISWILILVIIFNNNAQNKSKKLVNNNNNQIDLV